MGDAEQPVDTQGRAAIAPGISSATGRLPMLLLPGTLCDERLFAPLLARLPARAVTVPRITGARQAWTFAERVIAAAPQRFALLGFSLGGIIALEIAAAVPERVAGLALLGSNARPLDDKVRADRRESAQSGMKRGLGAFVHDTLWASYVAPNALRNAALQTLIVDMAEETRPAEFEAQLEIALTRGDARARLGALTMPSLVLAGEKDAICPPFMQSEMADALPDATLALVPDAGHFVLLEAPGRVAIEVAAWLDRVDRNAGPIFRANSSTTLSKELP